MRLSLAFGALLLAPALAQAQAAWPDLKGVWRGQSEAVMVGQTPHYADPPVMPIEPRSGQIEVTLTINGQQGRRVWGTLEGGGYKEVFIAMIGTDRRTIRGIDQDGYAEASLSDANTMDMCYRHATAASMLVSCVDFKRQP